MNPTTRLRATMLAVGILALSSAGWMQARSVAQKTPGPADLPWFGFNAKGSKDVDDQTARTNDLLDQITDPAVKHGLVIRVTGGTISQTTTGSDWTGAMIAKWADLRRKQGVRFVYVVNGNDSPANQAALIRRFLDAGATFDFIEMMNEYYLPKFARGDRSQSEVTRAITPELYVNEILPAYWRELDRFHLPYYLIFAPANALKGAQERGEHWNKVVARALNTTHRERDLHATVHLYARDGGALGNYDYDQIDRLRRLIPAGRHLAVTEAGIIDDRLDVAQLAPLAVAHYRNIVRHLRAGDYLLDQVLYNPAPRNNTATLNRDGLTPKGVAVLKFIRDGLR